jgi:hypothetical protein
MNNKLQAKRKRVSSFKIIYPPDFIKSCKKLYPHWKNLHTAIAKGSPAVEHLFSDVVSSGFLTPEEAIEIPTIEEIHDRAKIYMETRRLFTESAYIISKQMEEESKL